MLSENRADPWIWEARGGTFTEIENFDGRAEGARAFAPHHGGRPSVPRKLDDKVQRAVAIAREAVQDLPRRIAWLEIASHHEREPFTPAWEFPPKRAQKGPTVKFSAP